MTAGKSTGIITTSRFKARLALASLPVYRLPAELLIEIFCYFLQQSPYHQSLHHLAQVCLWWRDLILSHCPFWSVIDHSFGEKWAEWALKKAGGVPLTFVLLSTGKDEEDALSKFFELLKENTHRCRTLVILSSHLGTLDLYSNSIRGILHSRAFPLLTSFAIEIPDSHNYNPPRSIDYVRGGVQVFRRLALRQHAFEWHAPVLKDLTSLTLWHPSSPAIPFLEFIRIIRESPELTLLSLYDSRISAPTSQCSSSPSVDLPSLNELSLRGLSVEVTRALLTSIQAPNCPNIKIACHMRGASGSTIINTPTLQGVFDHISSTGKKVFNIALNMSSSSNLASLPFFCGGGASSLNISIVLDAVSDRTDALRSILSMISDATASTVISLRLFDAGPALDMLSALEEKFTQVEHLTLEVATLDNWEGLVGILSHSRDRIFLPSLRTLKISGGKSWAFRPQHFLDILRARAEPRRGRNGVGTVVAPKLRYLWVDGTYTGFEGEEGQEIYSLVEGFVEFN